MDNISIRPATSSDARLLRCVFEYASQGLSPYLWKSPVGPAEDYDAFVEARMVSKLQDPEQIFSVAEINGKAAGGILTYRIDEMQSVDGLSDMDRSFVEIDNNLFPSVYVNAIAVLQEYRRLGVAAALLQDAQNAAARDGLAIALSVSDANSQAISTYEACGYRHVGRVRMEKGEWQGAGANWLLMVNDTLNEWQRPNETADAITENPLASQIVV